MIEIKSAASYFLTYKYSLEHVENIDEIAHYGYLKRDTM